MVGICIRTFEILLQIHDWILVWTLTRPAYKAKLFCCSSVGMFRVVFVCALYLAPPSSYQLLSFFLFSSCKKISDSMMLPALCFYCEVIAFSVTYNAGFLLHMTFCKVVARHFMQPRLCIKDYFCLTNAIREPTC